MTSILTMIDIYDTIGFLGVGLIIIAYWRLQTGKLAASEFMYSFMNSLGAAFIIVSLLVKWNFAAFVIEVFWLAISIYGLFRYFRHRKYRL